MIHKQKSIFISLILLLGLFMPIGISQVHFGSTPVFAQSDDSGDDEPVNTSSELRPLDENPIVELLVEVINFLAVGVGLVVMITLIIGGVQYILSQGNPQKTAAARDKIVSALGALALYALMFAIIQWLIPGGVFS
jgi:hypothetical protein